MWSEGHEVANYKDDFTGVEPDIRSTDEGFLLLGTLFVKLGLDENPRGQKAISTDQRCRLLGITFDTMQLTLAIPEDKLSQISELLQACRNKESATKRELQSILGNKR